jgi:hypothetical protein
MRNAVILFVIGLFSLLMANETTYSMEFVLEHPTMYPDVDKSYKEYVLLSVMYKVAGVACLVTAAGLAIKVRRESK